MQSSSMACVSLCMIELALWSASKLLFSQILELGLSIERIAFSNLLVVPANFYMTAPDKTGVIITYWKVSAIRVPE